MRLARWAHVGVIGLVLGVVVPAAAAQQIERGRLDSAPTAPLGELSGVVHDDQQRPLGGAVVSALGLTTAVAVSDHKGHFQFPHLTPGSYLVRVHLPGYLPSRARPIQITPGGRSATVISLAADAATIPAPTVLLAGVGPSTGAEAAGQGSRSSPGESEDHDHDQTAWLIRHAKRSVLKAAEEESLAADGSFLDERLSELTRALGGSARVASSLFDDLVLSGEVNLLAATSLDRAQDLFSLNVGAPRNVAYVALGSPVADGAWKMRGAVTQADLASWMVAGSYAARIARTHHYEVGMSYGAQRDRADSVETPAASLDDDRRVAMFHAHDTWSIARRVQVTYGGQVARYDYVADPWLTSPRASVSVKPSAHDSLTVRATVSHTEIAPGAEEFLPPTRGLWLPPERTFSHISRAAFRPERVDHFEVVAERQWPGAVTTGGRVFRQRVQDQLVTMFGVPAEGTVSHIGHYMVGSAGDVDAEGWGVSVSRAIVDGVRASVDYTQAQAEWFGAGSDRAALVAMPAVVRSQERLHDVTASVDGLVAPTATRVLIIYKVNTAFASEAARAATAGTRFDVQVNQALPFLAFTRAQWEMLVAVNNLFRDAVQAGSIYDELLVVRPPTRMVGGVTVKF